MRHCSVLGMFLLLLGTGCAPGYAVCAEAERPCGGSCCGAAEECVSETDGSDRCVPSCVQTRECALGCCVRLYVFAEESPTGACMVPPAGATCRP